MLAIGTRFFGKDPAKDLPRLAVFLEAALKLGDVFVAVNTDEDTTNTLAFIAMNYPSVDAFSVTPWQKFVPALNAIVYRAATSGANRLLLASVEFPPTEEQVVQLLEHINSDTLVAGACFLEHNFQCPSSDDVRGTGTTVPWNTFAVWNIVHLAKLGFPLAGDAPFDPRQAGVEELTTIALYQALFSLKAKLVRIQEFVEKWNTKGWDKERLAKHEAKMASKEARPKAQMEWAGLEAPTIMHIA